MQLSLLLASTTMAGPSSSVPNLNLPPFQQGTDSPSTSTGVAQKKSGQRGRRNLTPAGKAILFGTPPLYLGAVRLNINECSSLMFWSSSNYQIITTVSVQGLRPPKDASYLQQSVHCQAANGIPPDMLNGGSFLSARHGVKMISVPILVWRTLVKDQRAERKDSRRRTLVFPYVSLCLLSAHTLVVVANVSFAVPSLALAYEGTEETIGWSNQSHS